MTYLDKNNSVSIVPNPENQSGMASVVIVLILVIILTLISVGFARTMDRAIKNSTNNQLGTSAYYVARSGISDASAYLAQNPNTVADTCDDLLGPGKPLEGASQSLSDASNGVAKYTCVLIDQTPTELNYQKIPAFKSQVVKLKPSTGSISTLLLSWQGSDPANNVLPSNKLYSQTYWATQKYEPMLRVTVYPVIGDSDSLGNIETRARTFFLYPSFSGGTNSAIFNGAGSLANGSRANVTCDYSPSATFTGTGYYHCNLSLTSLNTACGADCGYYYLRLTPLYGQADIKIKATTSGSTLAKFAGVQAVLDVTAKADTTVRRLAARVDLSGVGSNYLNISPGDDAIPENAIRTAGTLCKRLNISSTHPIPPTAIDPTAQPYCNLTL